MNTANALCTCGLDPHKETCLMSSAEFDAITADPAAVIRHKRARKRAMLESMLPRVIERADVAEKEFRRAFRRYDKLRSEERAIVRALDRLAKEDETELPALLKPQAQ